MKWEGHCVPVRRVLLASAGVDVFGKVCANKCGTPACVNPKHLVALSRRQFYRRTRQHYSMNLAQRARVAASNRARSKITPEIAEQIRQSTQSQTEIARTFGVSQAAVSFIRRGLRWANYVSGWAQLKIMGKK